MATEELVTEQFQFLGIDVQEEILSKCVQLCHEYNIDAETFVEQWMAFSLSHLNGAPPSLVHLDSLERKEFSKRVGDNNYSVSKDTSLSSAGPALAIYRASAGDQPEVDVLSNYVSNPKRIKVEADASSHPTELTPATYSPNVGLSAKYSSRSNAGTVVHSFGEDDLLHKLAVPNDLSILDLNVAQVANDDGDVFNKAMFGFELLHEKASIFDSHIRYISQYICKKFGITELSSVRHKSQTEVCVAGRIECDADARLNPKCVVLQGTWDESLSQTVPVDLDNVKQYSLFPGQVAVLRGVNPRGDRFIAHEVFTDASLPIIDHAADMMNTPNGKISLVAVSGPYTTSDNLAYEPLKDFVTYAAAHKPHVVIMTGPFLDSEHSKVKDNTMAEAYTTFFDKLVDSLGEICVASPITKIYVVSSAKDAFHVNVYPTPPYSSRKKHANVHFVSDPSTLRVGGLVVAVTSVDVLMQISQEEISLGMGGDKLARLASHVLASQSLSPLWPAPALATDAALWAAHAQICLAPYLLLLPTSFRYFVKEVNGCVVINPEHLTKGTGGGTFCRVLIDVNSTTEKVSRRIAAQIVRI